ncbi:MAG: MerR family transcriptional regulator [Pseudomonadota bacterium]
MAKSPDAFRTISEAADELDVPQHVLRFWETKFGQIRPLKRAGGRRYYRPADLDLLRGVRRLLYDEGFTIRGVQKLFREQGARYVSNFGSSDAPAEAVASVVATETEQSAGDCVNGASGSASVVSLEERQSAARALDAEGRRKLEAALARLEQTKAGLDAALAAKAPSDQRASRTAKA